MKRLRVYLSSTCGDLDEHRRAALDVILKAGFDCSAMEYYSAADERPVDLCVRDVRDCDIYVGLFAHRYGAIPAGYDYSFTELEYRAAVAKGIPTLLFLAPEQPWPDQLRDHPPTRIRALRAQLRETNVVAFFTTAASLEKEVAVALARFGTQHEWEQHTAIRARYERSQAARLRPELCEFLERYYRSAFPALRRGGLVYPVFCQPCDPSQRGDPESVLGPLVETDRTPAECAVYNEQYLDTLRHLGKTVYNGRTYVFDKLHDGLPLKVSCSLGYYFDAMATCDILEWELLTALGDAAEAGDPYSSLGDRLPLRTAMHARCPNPVMDGGGRSAALSVSTLIVYHAGDTYKALLRPRSGATAAHSDLYHVVPSFMFQPTIGDNRGEYSIRYNVYREYLEEVFSVPEMERSQGQIALDWFFDDPRLVVLRQLLDDGHAQLLLTGFAVNLLNLRPEICTLLFIRDQAWHKQALAANWEFLKPVQLFERRAQVLLPVNILQDDAGIGRYLATMPGTFVPPGAAAFWLGIDVARELAGYGR